MIKPMIDPSFSKYGTVERFSKEWNRTLEHISISNNREIDMYCFSFDTLWDYVEGMTLLVIRDGQQREEYYIDRTVTIRAGVRFGFCAMGEGSVVAGDGAILTPEAVVEVLNYADANTKKDSSTCLPCFGKWAAMGFSSGESSIHRWNWCL